MSAPRGTQLAWPFALVGFVGGAFVGAIAHEAWVVYVFAVVTAFVAACFGAIVTHRRRRAPLNAGMGTGAIAVGTLLAGATNGASIVCGAVLFQAPQALPWAFLAGLVVGVVFSLPFMPVLAHVAHADQQVGVARPGTLVDRAHRRGVWAVCLGWIGASMFFATLSRWSVDHLHALVVVAAVVIAAIAALIVADVRALLILRRSEEGEDHGIGPLDVIEHPPSGYRVPPTTSIVARDAFAARDEIGCALRRDVLAFLVACTGTVLFVLATCVRAAGTL